MRSKMTLRERRSHAHFTANVRCHNLSIRGPIATGLVFGGIHFIIVGWFALHLRSEKVNETLWALLATIDFPVAAALAWLQSLSGVSIDSFLESPPALYTVLLVFGSFIYFLIGTALGWVLGRLMLQKSSDAKSDT